MQNKPLLGGPTAITTSATNMLNSAITSLSGPTGYTQTQPYIILTHIRVVNKTSSPVTVSLFIGATGGSASGTEFAWNGKSVPANDAVDWYGRIVLTSSQYLTALAGTGSALTFEAEGEIGLS